MSLVYKKIDLPSLPASTQKEVKLCFSVVKDWLTQFNTELRILTDSIKSIVNTSTAVVAAHIAIVDGNPHGTDHYMLNDIEVLDPTDSNADKDKHLSNAQGKVWQDHVGIVNANPHGTDHSQLDAIGVLDTASSDATQDKHLSNAQGKAWQDHVALTASNPHGTDLDQLDDVDTTASKTTPVDADALLLQDSEASGVWKKLTWANLKTAALTAIYTLFTDVGEWTGFIDNDNIDVAYDSTARTITLTHSSGTITYYWQGVKKTLASPWTSSAHTATLDTVYYLSSSDGTNFTWATTLWSFHNVMVSVATYFTGYKFALREPHATMDHEAHEEAHDKIGTYRKSGGSLSGYTLASTTAADRRPDIAVAVIKDEDIRTTLATLTSETYTQAVLTATGLISFTAAAAEIVPVLAARPYYNSYSAPNWGQTLMTNNSYMSVWLVGIPVTSDAGSQAYRFIWVQGQSEGTLASQQALSPSSLNLGNLTAAFAEFVFLSQVILQFTASNWRLSEVRTITGSRELFTGASGNFLSTVTTDATLTGSGVPSSPLTVTYGTAAATACVGNDARLSDARTPTAHTTGSHSDWPVDVSMTEVGYLDGVTSAVQTQLNGKEVSGTTATHAALTATHGISGAIVGTTDTQNLTNKTVNKLTITAPATGSTLTIADGKTLTSSNTLTLTATDGSTLAVGTGGTLGTAAYTTATDYAVTSKGVTNGDSHDHSGGDGAQIAYSGLGGIPSTFTPASHNNTAHSETYITASSLHAAVTVTDSTSIDLTLTGQQISAAAIFGTTSGTVCQGDDSRLSGSDISTVTTLVSTATGNITSTLSTTSNVAGYIKSTGDVNTVSFTTSDGSTIAQTTVLTVQYESVLFVKKSNVWYIL